MKLTFTLTLIILILLSLYVTADSGYLDRLDHIIFSIEQIPIVIFSHDWHLLLEIGDELHGTPNVASLKIERNEEILEKMMFEYELSAADRILDIDLLPNVLRFHLNGSEISEQSYQTLMNNIQDKSHNLSVVTQDRDFQSLFDLKSAIVIRRLILFSGLLLTLFILCLTLRIASIKQNNRYWRIYYRAGGTGKRVLSFLPESIVSSFLPVICFALILIAAEKYLLFTYFLDLNSLLIIIGTVLITSPIAWAVTGKQ